MSHHTVYKTNLIIKDKEILIDAVKELAEKLGIKVGNTVYDFSGTPKNVIISIHPSEVPKGIGFDIDSEGKLEVVGDRYLAWKSFDHYTELVKNYVNAYVTRKQIKKLYPTAKIKEVIRDKVVEMEVEIL